MRLTHSLITHMTSPHELVTVAVAGIDIRIPAHQSNVAYIGGGTFGLVASAYDPTLHAYQTEVQEPLAASPRNTPRNPNVAVKRLTGPFRSHIHAKRAYREVKLLRMISQDVHAGTRRKRCEDVVNFYTAYTSTPREHFDDVYINMELCESDLHHYIHNYTLTEQHVCDYSYQLIRGLKYLHSAGIVHRDLKPSNIAVYGGT